MNKIAIVTLYGNVNFGNKLQNYAIQCIYESLGFCVETLKISNSNYNKSKSQFINIIISIVMNFYRSNIAVPKFRNNNFRLFEKKYLKNKKNTIYYFNINNISDNYYKFSIGSDQVWNPVSGLDKKIKFLDSIESSKKISFSASFGVDKIPTTDVLYYTIGLKSIQHISVREYSGKEIIENLTGRKDVEVLIDPTMMLDGTDWEKVAHKPNNHTGEKYILNYFLGELSNERRNIIYDYAQKNNLKVINLTDKNDLYYDCGPSEFLWLEKNATLICTDSFHSSVFAILFNKPFIIFDREQQGVESMNSRIDTLLSKFNIQNRKFNGKYLSKKNIEHDYTKAYKILEVERKKVYKFLKTALDVK